VSLNLTHEKNFYGYPPKNFHQEFVDWFQVAQIFCGIPSNLQMLGQVKALFSRESTTGLKNKKKHGSG